MSANDIDDLCFTLPDFRKASCTLALSYSLRAAVIELFTSSHAISSHDPVLVTLLTATMSASFKDIKNVTESVASEANLRYAIAATTATLASTL